MGRGADAMRLRVLAALGAVMFAAALAAPEVETDPGDGYDEPAPPKAPNATGPEPVCPLTDEQADKAVEAFSRMMPALSNPRCANCHGGVNPFAENGGHVGGQIKLENIAERWLANPKSFRDTLAAENGGRLTEAQIKNAEDALRTIQSAKGENLGPETIADILLEGGLEQAVASSACSSCHEHQPVRWRVAKSRFAGLSAKSLCETFQKHPDVTSPAEFLDHMARDPLEFIPVAFEGTRALTPLGQGIYKEVRGKAYSAEPITTISRTALDRAAADWGTALGGKYRKPASCGCEKKNYKLEVKIKFDVDFGEGPKYGFVDSNSLVRLPVKFTEERKFTAEGKTPVKNFVDGGVGADNCKIEQPGEEDWKLTGSINPDSNELTVAGTVATKMAPATMICIVDGKRITQSVPSFENAEDLEKYSFKLPALVGEPKEFRDAIPYGERIVTLKIVEE